MKYGKMKEATFLARPNRFIAHVRLDGKMEVCHVKNTGRCRELLVPGATVYVQETDNPARKTRYDLITVKKGERLVNIDSQIPNKVFAEWLKASGFIGGLTLVKPETTYGSSRFDFYLEAGVRRIFAEVKGVTLEEEGVAMFPDAPTERGVKHIEELIRSVQDGYEAMIVFIIQMKEVRCFTPNRRTHAAFGEALSRAKEQGVSVIALDCHVTEDSIAAADFVEIKC